MMEQVRFFRLLGLFVAAAFLVAACAGVITLNPRPVIPQETPPPPGRAVPLIDINAPGRTADLLADWSQGLTDATGISQSALEAYGYAATVLAHTNPGCGIDWTTLAGIGSVESKHGTHGGASVDAHGNAAPPIRGVVLDGGPSVAHIPDTDGGVMDGDPEFDRAMGPMQFIPETWVHWGVDANGDGVADPDNIDDAALSAARYLCNRGGDLRTAEGWRTAIFAYNLSGDYVDKVREHAAAYSVAVRP
ncbi:MAG: murein transglycosylase [Rhodococcus sp.]|nr:murein transglycosylase [Rhodococcus sp. (in: high G+C Gram-positive bacteria)]